MPDTARPRLGLQAVAGADNANTIDSTNDAQMDIIDAQAAIFSQGTFASRPTSTGGTPGITGRFYYATDIHVLFYDHGTGWVEVEPLAYRTLSAASGAGTTAFGTGAHLLATSALASHGAAIVATALPTVFRFDDADFASEGRAQKLRVRAVVLVDETAPGVTLTVGLYPVNAPSSGTWQLGTVVSGSTVPFVTPAANSKSNGNSGDFAIPGDGEYALGVALSGTIAASSTVFVSAQLQSRTV